jgi:hypothetical protein
MIVQVVSTTPDQPGIRTPSRPARQRFERARAWLSPLSHATSEKARAERVVMLLVATLLMSLGDLYMTLTMVTSVGMLEANPFSRLVMEQNSPALVVLWRMGTLIFGLAILAYFRRLARAELASWVCFFALLALTLYWIQYIEALAIITPGYESLAQGGDPEFVIMDAR